MKNKFVKLDGWGELRIDKVLFDAGYPVLFTCINDKRDLFICVCCQNNEDGTKWMISKTTADSVGRMLKNEITIRALFLEEKNNRFSVDAFGGEVKVIRNNERDWAQDSICLPKENEYMDAEEGEAEEEIQYFENFDLKDDAADRPDVDDQMRFDLLSDVMPSAVEGVVYVNTISEIVKVCMLVENMHLDKDYMKGCLMRYLAYAGLHKKEAEASDDGENVAAYEYTSKQISIFDRKNETDTDLLDAA